VPRVTSALTLAILADIYPVDVPTGGHWHLGSHRRPGFGLGRRPIDFRGESTELDWMLSESILREEPCTHRASARAWQVRRS
jgi:hypothetical protein